MHHQLPVEPTFKSKWFII